MNAHWTCEVGPADRGSLPDGCDLPMRQAVRAAFRALTGNDPEYLSSGWGRPTTEPALPVDVACSKCGGTEHRIDWHETYIATRWHQRVCGDRDTSTKSGEHLHYYCQHCHYDFTSPVLALAGVLP